MEVVGKYAPSITIFFHNNTAGRFVMVAKKFSNPTLFAFHIVPNHRMAQLVPRPLCVVAAATGHWITTSHLRPRIS